MLQYAKIAALSLSVLCVSGAAVAKTGSGATTAILVDKKTNTLRVTEYDGNEYKVLKTYHATLGQVMGDKIDEGDLKTPEGIYTFTAVKHAPGINPKLGKMAFHINFPNNFDQIAGMTGFDIMLHGTNEPERLTKNYDSQGCVVVKNEEITEIAQHIRLGLTPIIIFPEMTDDYLKPDQDQKLRKFFDSWIHDWETKNLDGYIGHYHSDFTAQGKSLSGWKAYKGSLNKRYKSIEIGPESVKIYRHPKYSMITFTQNYRSKLNGGGWGHRSRGTKILYIAEEAGQPKIIAETYTTLMW